MRILCVLLALERVRLLWQVLLAKLAADVLAHFGYRVGRDARRVGTHIGDEADCSLFATQVDTFIKALRHPHGALDVKAELARRILLQFAGGKWRSRRLLALTAIHFPDRPVGLLDGRQDLLCHRFGGNRRSADRRNSRAFAIDADEASREFRAFRRRIQMCIDRPVFNWIERLDLTFALHDQAESDSLHTAGGESATYLIPEQRGDLVAHDAIEHTAGLLRVHQVAVDGTGIQERSLDGLGRDLIKGDAMDGALGRVVAQLIFKMCRDGLAFAVRIGRQVHSLCTLGQLLEAVHHLYFIRHHDQVGRKTAVFEFDTNLVLGQILHVAQRGFDDVVLTEIFVDRLGLRGRFDDH